MTLDIKSKSKSKDVSYGNLPELPKCGTAQPAGDFLERSLVMSVNSAEELAKAYGRQCWDRAHFLLQVDIKALANDAGRYLAIRNSNGGNTGPADGTIKDGFVFAQVWEHKPGTIPTTKGVVGEELDQLVDAMKNWPILNSPKKSPPRNFRVVTQGCIVLEEVRVLNKSKHTATLVLTVEGSNDSGREIEVEDVESMDDFPSLILKYQYRDSLSPVADTIVEFPTFEGWEVWAVAPQPDGKSVRVALQLVEEDLDDSNEYDYDDRV